MPHAKLRNVDRFLDRHGKPRHYFRVGKGRRMRLPGEPGSAEFMAAYRRAADEIAFQLSDATTSSPAGDGLAASPEPLT